MTENNKKHLGWGLVGTPNGRQYTSDGIDKQLNLGKIFELGQELGGCLPDPKLGDFTPLYALQYRYVNNIPVLGFAEYISINERGQSRSGTYFGSFIEVAGASFGVDSISTIFGALRELSIYQTKNFIDIENKVYHSSINGRTFDAPHSLLDKIAAQLQAMPTNYLTQNSQSKDLFIHCNAEQAKIVAAKLLEEQLFYNYQNIFFSENEHISRQIQNSRITQIHASELLASHLFIQPWKSEVSYLHSVVSEVQAQNQVIQAENLRLKNEQSQLISQAVQEQAKVYIQDAEHYKAEMQKAQSKLDTLGYDDINQKLSHLDKKLTVLVQKNQESVIQPLSVEPVTNNRMAAILGILSAVLFLFAIGGWASYFLDDSSAKAEKLENEKKALVQEKNELKKSLDETDAKQKKLEEQLRERDASSLEKTKDKKKDK
ncbi:coiled-coil domain-containing protein [Actinobacillus porcinus]|uniref:coiled-coil domain-containing protein n=1 Tax=Actinobacillus porcinus TaxID=51048 RepID=UPI00235225DD|nr:hypothetical protein [Actinobacillus porcinus]